VELIAAFILLIFAAVTWVFIAIYSIMAMVVLWIIHFGVFNLLQGSFAVGAVVLLFVFLVFVAD
jgi:hypothetical protein